MNTMATEKSLNEFAYAIRASVDHAGPEINNSGSLWKQPGGDLDHVRYPAPVGALLPDGVDLRGEPLTLTARDWHGLGRHSLTFWLETNNQPGWNMPAITGRYYEDSDVPALISIGNEPSDEETFSRYVTSYMSLVPDLSANIAAHGMAMAFREGIGYIAESGIAYNSIVKRTGHKVTPNNYVNNGFQLKAHIMDETDSEGNTTTTIGAELSYFFRPTSIEEMPYGGRLLKVLNVTLRDDKIIAAERESTLSLQNNPFVSGSAVGTYSDGSAADASALPQRFREHLYPDKVVSDEDTTYFVNLATKPLKEEDVIIL